MISDSDLSALRQWVYTSRREPGTPRYIRLETWALLDEALCDLEYARADLRIWAHSWAHDSTPPQRLIAQAAAWESPASSANEK